MDTTQWPEQGIGVVKVVPMEGDNNSSGAAAVNNNTKAIISAAAAPRPQKPQALNCPRCNSAHTKFCYYNNYSLTQPRYFCKTCRRYWTEGGSLRNVPVGGGSRKNKRCSSSSNPTIAASSSSSSLSKNIKLPHEIITSNSQNPNSKIIFHDQGQDLNLAYPPTGPSTYNSTATGISEFVEFPSATSSHHQFSQLLKSGIGGRGSFTSFMSMIPVSDSSNNNSAAIYSSSSAGAGLPFQEFSKPITSGVNFSLDQQHGFESSGGGGGVYGSLQLGVHQESSGSNNHAKLFNFPFEDLKQQPVLLNSSTTSTQDAELMDQRSRGTTVTTTNTTQGDHHHHHHHHQSPAGYWNNINGGGSW